MIDADTELKRWNELTQQDAKSIMEKMEGQQAALRSCWYCNDAHEHLKKADYPFNCLWGCGQWYLSGYPALVVARRSEGIELSPEDFKEFVEVIHEGSK